MNPMGSPIYIAAPENHSLNIAEYKLVSFSDAAEVAIMELNKGNDPHRLIKGNEAFFVPDLPLRENTEYKFVMSGDDNGKSFQKSFNFTTGLQY